LRVLEFLLLRKWSEFFRNLVMIEREDDITEIVEDDLDATPLH
jgi:hypothetical protein